MGKYLFGADFGTSGVKAVLLDPLTGGTIGSDLFEYEMKHVEPLWAEQTPGDWWDMLGEASRQVLGRANSKGDDIIAIAFSTFGCTTVCVDEHGEAMGEAMTWMDGRTGEEAEWLNANMADEIKKVNSNVISTLPTTANFRWLEKHDSERFTKARGFCGVLTYINMRMTGQFVVPPSEATFCHVFNLKTLEHSKSLCDKLGIPYEKLAKVVPSTDIIGSVTEEAAQKTGIAAGTPVAAGTQDNASASLGMGVYAPGQVFFSMGTAGNMGVIMDEPRSDDTLMTQAFLFPQTWLMLATMGNNGACLKWFHDNIAAEIAGQPVNYDTLNALAQSSPAGCGGVLFLPYLAGELSPVWDEKARACFIGMTPSTNAGRLIRAVMEGVCLAIRHNLVMYERASCVVGDSIRIAGGPTNSTVWMQILADVTGKRVIVPEVTEAGPLGDAMLAGIACGSFAGPREAAEKCVGVKAEYRPNADNEKIYGELFEIYQGLYPKLKDDFHKLSVY